MNTKANISAHWRLLLSLMAAVGVFCLWGYVYPYLVTERELTQLFLWNSDYFMQRVAVPGGLARYIAEWLVQFFVYIKYGAFIYALLFLAIQGLAWVIIRNLGGRTAWLYLVSFLPAVFMCWLATDLHIPLTPHIALLLVLLTLILMPDRQKPGLIYALVLTPVVYWLAGPLSLLIALYQLRFLSHRADRSTAVGSAAATGLLWGTTLLVSAHMVPYPLAVLAKGIDYQLEENRIGTYEDMTYYTLLRRGQWEKIIEKAHATPPQSLATQHVVRLAMWYTKRIDEAELKACVLQPRAAMTSTVATGMMSDVWLHLGFVNMSQWAAFEVQESILNGNKSGRLMQRLTETALFTGQYEVALKYISLLEQTLFYRSWAQSMRQIVMQPELIHKNPQLHRYEKVYAETEDLFF